MSMELLPDWADFERDYIDAGVPYRIVVQKSPAVELFLEAGAARFGAWFEPVAGMTAAFMPLREIRTEEVLVDGSKRIAVWTDQTRLFPKFYALLQEVFKEVVDRGHSPADALGGSIAEWEALLERADLLSPEAQAGLFGELWLLQRLIQALGPQAVQAWTGPRSEAHDFRLAQAEIEVKTTAGARRIHTINGIAQLQASPGFDLYLLSLQLTDAGSGGHSLPEMVAAISKLIEADADARAQFDDYVMRVGYRNDDAVHYRRRRKLRSAPVLVKIEDGVPRIVPSLLGEIPSRYAPDRFGRISYEIDVDGLGQEDGSPDFLSVIPAPKG